MFFATLHGLFAVRQYESPQHQGYDTSVPDSGQSEYFIKGTERDKTLSSWFPKNAAIVERNNAYLSQVEADLKNHRYGLVIVTQNVSPILSENFLGHYYTYAGSIIAPMPGAAFYSTHPWLLDVYEPNR